MGIFITIIKSILYGETWNDFLIVIKILHVKNNHYSRKYEHICISNYNFVKPNLQEVYNSEFLLRSSTRGL